MAAIVNVSEAIDRSRIGPFQIGVFVLCGVCLLLDGFDVQSMGFVAPALIADWGVLGSSLGPVFGAAPLGVLFGSLLFSMVADRVGRRPVLIGSTVFFAVMTLLTARAQSVNELLALRFLGGIGMGSIMPNAVALAGEYSPKLRRVAVMMIVSNGFTAGAAVGGYISSWLIPAFGWRSVFFFGGAAPLVLAVAMFFWLPESLTFMATRRRRTERIGPLLRRIDASAPIGDVEYVGSEQRTEGVPFRSLFHDGRALGTVLLWITNFMNLLNLYLLSSWLPTVVSGAGFATSTAVRVGATLQAAGTVGALALGFLIHRLGFVPVLAAGFTVACVSVAMIGQPELPLVFLYLVVFGAGFCIVGGQAGINALAASYYPTDLRSTGIGAGLGVGRLGAIVGPVLAGEMLSRAWSTRELFLAAAVPALISAMVMLSMRGPMRAAAPGSAVTPPASLPREAERRPA